MNKNRIYTITFIIFTFSFCITACFEDAGDGSSNSIYKENMQDFVKGISNYSKNIKHDFFIVPQNGLELVTVNGNENGTANNDYLDAIDGIGCEDLYYGYENDDIETSDIDKNYLNSFLHICENNDVEVLVTDYCFTEKKVDNSYKQNDENSFISFAAPERELNTIPTYPQKIYNENTSNINGLSDAQNFLYLINPDGFTSKSDFLDALNNTNYDVLIIDLFFDENQLTKADIESLKTKKNGAKRLVLCYISIGEAENYRYYWQNDWNMNPPEWLKDENSSWSGNYKVQYWNTDWQNIIYGNTSSYIYKIINSGFDGAYLDIIDAFEYFE